MKREVIIALDFGSGDKALEFLDRFSETKPFVKIGMELYYAEGPAIVRELKERGHKVFLDLKLHDIPNTVKKAMKVLSGMDIDMCNVHAGGTIAMMEAALEGLRREDGTRPLLIAVTQLTSTSQEQMEDDLLIEEDMEKVVGHYAYNTKLAGLDGQMFLDETEDTYCVWRASFDRRRNLCRYGMDLFQLDGARWVRSAEEHDEYAYTPDELEQYLREAGFTDIRRFGDRTFRRPKDDALRIYFAARKKEQP